MLDQPDVLEYTWVVLALISPAFANDFAKALYDKFEVTLSFLLHVELRNLGNRKACLVQGVFGSGKTFTTSMLAFLNAVLLAHKTLRVCQNNVPLEEASLRLSLWINSTRSPSVKSCLAAMFKRVLALKHATKHLPVDISGTLEAWIGQK